MAVKDIFKVSRKTFFNPRAWLDYDGLKSQTTMLWGTLKRVFTLAKPERQETYEEAMQRFGLSEAEAQERGQLYLAYAYFFLLFATSSIISGFYLLFHHKTISGWLLAIAVTALFLSQAFRYHFWYFQIKHRKLGCTLQEWRQGKVNPSEDT